MALSRVSRFRVARFVGSHAPLYGPTHGKDRAFAREFGWYAHACRRHGAPAIDFTTIEIWTAGGLVTYYLLFVMEVATRRVYFAGCTPNPDGPWMKQAARNLTDCEDGFLNGSRYLIMDRDTKFTDQFRKILEDESVNCVKLPARSPNLNSHLERYMKTIKEECLLKMIFFGEKMLRVAVNQFITHYHEERNHQGLGNRLIDPGEEVGQSQGEVQCRERLGGLLRYYHRKAA